MGSRSMQFRDAAPSEDDLQRRFYEIRYDEDSRTLTGTAMRYGDIAELPWGEKERFEPGAFAGNLSDIILNFQHDRARPLARTGGGGLRMEDSAAELRVVAELPKTREADDVLELVRRKILRGFSIEFLPVSHRVEEGVTVYDKAELRNVGLVDRPAYRQSKVQPRSESMGEEEIRKLIEAALKKREDKSGDVDVAELVRSITKANASTVEKTVKEQVREQVAEALKERDEAEEKRKKAEKERADAEKKSKQDRADIEANAEKRATTIADCRAAEMFDKDFDPKGKTRKEIMIAALGDEVKDAEERSEDYLEAKLEVSLERRAEASRQRQNPGKGGGTKPTGNPSNVGGGVNVIRMIESRRSKQRASA